MPRTVALQDAYALLSGHLRNLFGGRIGRILALASPVLSALWLSANPHVGSTARLVLTTVTATTFIALFATLRSPENSAPPKQYLVGTSIVMIVLAVGLSPRDSHDVWSYVMYGREAAVHHANPYEVPPNAFPADPLLGHVALGWRHVESVYGPAFTGLSALFAFVATDSPVINRLAHQALAGVAVMICASLSARRSATSWTYVLLPLNPAVLGMINGGHNDLLAAAVAAYGIVLLGRERRSWFGAIASAVAISVKATALLPVGIGVLWILRERTRRAVWLATLTIGIVFIGYVVAGGLDALGPLLDAPTTTSRASLWSGPITLLEVFVSADLAVRIANICAFLLVAISGLLCWRSPLLRQSPMKSAAIVAIVFVFVSPYVLPWYAALSVILAAGSISQRIQLIATLQSVALLVAYANPPGTPNDGVVGVISALVYPAAALFAVWLWQQNRAIREEANCRG